MDHVAEFSVRSILVTWRGFLLAEVLSIERYHHEEKFSGVALLKLFENEGHFFKLLRLAPHVCGLNYRLIEVLPVLDDVCRALGNISFVHCSNLKKLLQKFANSGGWIYRCSEFRLVHGWGIPSLFIRLDRRIILLLLYNYVCKSFFNCFQRLFWHDNESDLVEVVKTNNFVFFSPFKIIEKLIKVDAIVSNKRSCEIANHQESIHRNFIQVCRIKDKYHLVSRYLINQSYMGCERHLVAAFKRLMIIEHHFYPKTRIFYYGVKATFDEVLQDQCAVVVVYTDRVFSTKVLSIVSCVPLPNKACSEFEVCRRG